jgi:hypothetical protein
MQVDTLPHIDAAIREVLTRIARQRDFIEEFAAKGYDMRAPLTLLCSLLVNLRNLERRRQALVAESNDVVRA